MVFLLTGEIAFECFDEEKSPCRSDYLMLGAGKPKASTAISCHFVVFLSVLKSLTKTFSPFTASAIFPFAYTLEFNGP